MGSGTEHEALQGSLLRVVTKRFQHHPSDQAHLPLGTDQPEGVHHAAGGAEAALWARPFQQLGQVEVCRDQQCSAV